MITYKQVKLCQRLGFDTSFIPFSHIQFDNEKEYQEYNFGMMDNIKKGFNTVGRTIGNAGYVAAHGTKDAFKGAITTAKDVGKGLKQGLSGAKNTVDTVSNSMKEYKNNFKDSQYKRQAIGGMVNAASDTRQLNGVDRTKNRFTKVGINTIRNMKRDHVQQRFEHGQKDIEKGMNMMKSTSLSSPDFKQNYQAAKNQINKGYGQIRSGYNKTAENIGLGVNRALQTAGGTLNRVFRGKKNLFYYY